MAPPAPAASAPVPAAAAPPAPRLDPLDPIRKSAAAAKFLAKTAPNSFKAREITSWIKKNITHPDQRTILEDVGNTINDLYESRAGEQKIKLAEEIRAIASEWGLPFGLAGTADIKLLIKVLAATATINM